HGARQNHSFEFQQGMGMPPTQIAELQRIQILEGSSNKYGISYAARAMFNLSRNLDDIAPGLAHRVIPLSPGKMQELDNLTLELSKSIIVKITDQDLDQIYKEDNSNFDRRLENIFSRGADADLSTRTVIASELIYMTHGHLELLRRLLFNYGSLRFI